MAGGLILDSNAAEIIAKFRKLPAAIQSGIVRSLGRTLILMRQDVRTNAQVKFTGGRSGLITRLTSYAKAQGNSLDAAIGFRKTKGFPYELSQEFGATAKAGKAMVVPISPLAKSASQRGIGPRQLGIKLFIPQGSRFLAEAKKNMSTIHYVLIKGLKPRLNFMKTVTERMGRISEAVVQGYAEGAKPV